MEQELLALQAEIKASKESRANLEKEIAELKKGVDTPEQKAEAAKLVSAKEKELAEMKSAMETLNTKFDAIKLEKGEPVKFINPILTLSQNAEFKSIVEKVDKNQLSGIAKVEMKVDPIQTLSTALSPRGAMQVSSLESGVDKPMLPMPRISDYIPVVRTNSAFVYWTERITHTNGVGGQAEGAKSGQSNSTWEEKKVEMKGRGVNFKYSRKAFQDMPQLIQDLALDVEEEVGLDIDDQIINGDDAGQNFNGLLKNATTFDATAVKLNAKITKPNFADVVYATALQVGKQGKGKWEANVCFCNPLDAAGLDFEKTPEGVYILPPFKDANGRMIAGVTIVPTYQFAEGEILTLDTNRQRRYENVTREMRVWEQNEDDAVTRMVTITHYLSGNMRIKESSKKAMVKATIATVIAALEKPTI